MKKHLILSVLLALPVALIAADKKAAKINVLTAGSYTAQIKSVPCEGCAGLIEETLSKNPSLENVKVSIPNKSVTFQVKKDAKVNMTDLQASLKGAADQMGMGADYQLDQLKKS